MIVVSEMGEQWSPKTAPAIHAAIPITRRSGSVTNTGTAIGMRIPIVPHDVPVANAMKHAIIMNTAGRKFLRLPASARASLTNVDASNEFVM